MFKRNLTKNKLCKAFFYLFLILTIINILIDSNLIIKWKNYCYKEEMKGIIMVKNFLEFEISKELCRVKQICLLEHIDYHLIS